MRERKERKWYKEEGNKQIKCESVEGGILKTQIKF